MSPKRKVPARRASGKRVRIGDTSVIPPPTLSPSGRSMRRASAGINYRVTATRNRSGPSTQSPKKLAKRIQEAQEKPAAAKVAKADTAVKRRGRPPASAKADPPVAKATAATASKPARGRPKKVAVESPPVPEPVSTKNTKSSKRKRAEVEEEPVAGPPKKRGRPAKVNPEPAKEADKPHSSGRSGWNAGATVKKAGKPTAQVETKALRKPLAKKVDAPAEPVATRIGRPPGSKNKVKDATAKVEPTAVKKGRPVGAKNKPKAAAKKGAVEIWSEDEGVEGLTQPDDEGAPELQYWLMKAEPDTRIEKGVDVAYPIDKLAAATEPEPWDGVRNAVARNKMRAMRKGDLAFFYHSNCSNPGIVGVMRIAEEHSIDESAFDPTHPYYDEKSDRSRPKWDCVKVEFVKKFAEIVSLKTLKNTPELSEMQIAQKAYGRLSVQSVRPSEWVYVLEELAGEDKDLGVGDRVSGYEADTNGETDGEMLEEVVEDSAGLADVDNRKIAAYGQPDESESEGDMDGAGARVNGNGMDGAVSDEVQAEHDRVEAIDAFAKEIAAGGEF